MTEMKNTLPFDLVIQDLEVCLVGDPYEFLPLDKGKANASLRGDSRPTLVDEPCVAGSNPKINNKYTIAFAIEYPIPTCDVDVAIEKLYNPAKNPVPPILSEAKI